MSSIREQVMVALVAAHEVAQVTGGTTVTKPTWLNVHRHVLMPIEEDDLPAMVIAVDTNEPERFDINRNMNSLTFYVESRVVMTATDAPDKTLDPLQIWSHRCIKTDETLGGLVSQITEGATEWAWEAGETNYASCRTLWTATFVTQEDDPRLQ